MRAGAYCQELPGHGAHLGSAMWIRKLKDLLVLRLGRGKSDGGEEVKAETLTDSNPLTTIEDEQKINSFLLSQREYSPQLILAVFIRAWKRRQNR